MISEIDVIRILLDIDEASVKGPIIKKWIRELLDGAESARKPEKIPVADSKEEPPALPREKEIIASGRMPEKAAEKQSGGVRRRKQIDWGKAEACRRAGWSIEKIADELGCSGQTVRNHFKKTGVI